MKNLFKLGFIALAVSLSVVACTSNKTSTSSSDTTITTHEDTTHHADTSMHAAPDTTTKH